MTTAIGFHIVLRLADDRALAPSPAARRTLAAALRRYVDRFGTFAFRSADTHLHVACLLDRPEAGTLVRSLAPAVLGRLHPGVRTEPGRIRAILDQRHLEATLGYILRQDLHHGLEADPTHDASSLPELMGWRVGGDGLRQRVAARLPRYDARQWLARIPDPVVAAAAPRPTGCLADAAAAAFALPDLHAPSNAVTVTHAARTAARSAAIAVALRLALGAGARPPTSTEIADELGLARRTVERLRSASRRATAPVPDAHSQAVMWQLRLRGVAVGGLETWAPVGRPTAARRG